DDVSWVLERLRAEHLEWLRERWKRGRARLSEEPTGLPKNWERGTFVTYDDVFSFDWDMTVVHDKRLYHVVDQYCPNPRCTCYRVVADFYDLTEDGRRVGHADALLGALRSAKVDGEPIAALLW